MSGGTEARLRAFAALGQRLSAVRTMADAGRIVVETADQLLGWDSCWLDLYDSEHDRLTAVLYMDIVDGQRGETPSAVSDRPGRFARQAIDHGQQLTLLSPDDLANTPMTGAFGDISRPSASIMVAPIRNGDHVRAIFSIQSYSFNAYTLEDLGTFQALADHCGGALERIQAEAALHASQARFQALIEHSSDAVALIDPQGVILYSSPSTAGLVGYAPAELEGRSIFELIHPDDASRVGRGLARTCEQAGGRVVGQFRYHHRDGSWRWIEAVVHNLLAEPNVQAIVANYRDITQRVENEAQIAQRGQELLTLHQIGQAVSRLSAIEDTLQRIFDVMGQALDNRNFFIALYDDARQMITFPIYSIGGELQPPRERPVANGVTEYVIRNRKAVLLAHDARGQLASLGITPIERAAASLLAVPMIAGDEVIGVMAVQDYEHDEVFGEHERDLLSTIATQAAVALSNARLYQAARQELAERELIEGELRAAETRYRALVEQLPAIIYQLEMTPQGNRTVYISPQVQTLLGFSPEEWLADDKLWIRQLHPDDRDGVLQSVAETDDGRLSINLEYRVLSRDGRTLWFRNRGVWAPDERTGQLLHAMGIMFDISERKEHEHELQALAAVSAALRQAPNRAALLPIILEQASGVLGLYGAALAMCGPAQDSRPLVLANGVWRASSGTRLPADDGLTGQVIASGEPFMTEQLETGQPFAQSEPPQAGMAAICEPLIADSQPIGALWAVRPLPFGAADVRLLSALADMTANAVQRATLHEQTLRRAEQLAALNALGRALAETLDLPQIYEQLYEATVQLLPDLAGAMIALYDDTRQVIVAGFGVHEGERIDVASLSAIPLQPPGSGTQSQAIRTRQPVIINNMSVPLKSQTVEVIGAPERMTQSGLFVPMLAKNRVIGVLQAQSYTPGRFSQSDAELLTLAANTGAIAIENARLFAETERRLHYVQALNDIDRAITSSMDLRVTLNVLLDQATRQLGVDAAAVLLLNQHLQTLNYAAGRGFRTKGIERTQLRVGEGYAGRAALERRMLNVPDVAAVGANFGRPGLVEAEAFVAYYAVPLIAKGEVKGVLDLYHRGLLDPDPEWLDFLHTLAGQAAVAVDSANMFNSVQRSNIELSLAYNATIEGWSRALDLRDKETEGHTQRVTEMSERLARALGIDGAELVHLRRGALLHDIGKMGIPDSILLKPGPLTEEEWVIMRRHPEVAFELLSPIAYLRPALDIPYCHHEKWDGSGYPRGLKGEQIPLTARIFAVIDVWDALRSDRPYRAAWSRPQVIEYLRQGSGLHFEPRLVEAFVALEEA